MSPASASTIDPAACGASTSCATPSTPRTRSSIAVSCCSRRTASGPERLLADDGALGEEQPRDPGVGTLSHHVDPKGRVRTRRAASAHRPPPARSGRLVCAYTSGGVLARRTRGARGAPRRAVTPDSRRGRPSRGNRGAGLSRDQLRELRFGVRGDQHDADAVLGGQPVGDVEAALGPEVDVDEHAVGPQFTDQARCIVSRRRDRDDVEALSFQQVLCRGEEVRVVVDDHEASSHDSTSSSASQHGRPVSPGCLPASRKAMVLLATRTDCRSLRRRRPRLRPEWPRTRPSVRASRADREMTATGAPDARRGSRCEPAMPGDARERR